MFDNSSSIIVGLEIGTSKICAVVGDLSPEGALNIVGLGQARSRGVRKGEISDPSLAEEDIRHAIVEAEQMADVEIRIPTLGPQVVIVLRKDGSGIGTRAEEDRCAID